jgi:hypothetical protein
VPIDSHKAELVSGNEKPRNSTEKGIQGPDDDRTSAGCATTAPNQDAKETADLTDHNMWCAMSSEGVD